MEYKIPCLILNQKVFINSKDEILQKWVEYESPKNILKLHKIDSEVFINKYASGVFDYFMGVISGELEVGNCPVMQELLSYLKDREISADELFELCNYFRRSMVDFTYDYKINSKEIFDEIFYIFDTNFRGILKFYTDTIFQKLVDARQEALKAGQAKEYFLSNMSHEIRTPLNAILGFVNLLIEEDLTKKHRNYLEIIQNSGENLLCIMNDILDFSKLKSGEFTVEPKIFSLHDELSHTMELFVATASSKDITILSFIDPGIAKELFADALRIKQILSNFISNAIKFTSANGIISVEASCKNKILTISVEDTGIGIKKDDIENIFTAFAQAQFSDNSSHDGTGLGLSISHQLAELMGGSVNVESSVGKGSRFWMEIPIEIHSKECKIFNNSQEMNSLKIGLYSKTTNIAYQYNSLLKYTDIFGMNTMFVNSIENDCDVVIFIHESVDYKFRNLITSSDKKFIALMSKEYDDYEEFENVISLCFPLYCSKIYDKFNELLKHSEDKEFKQKQSTQYDGNILVAEDNEANQELIKIILSKYGLRFKVVNDGLEALNSYKEDSSYDLILMDEQMPVMDGNEAIKEILKYEKENKLRHTPISALTANVIKGARERGLLHGYDSFLGKPVILKELERVLSTYLKIKASSVDTKIVDKDDKLKILGLDIEKLREELLLEDNEIVMLLNLFIQKMKKTLPELEHAIKLVDFKKIRSLAHAIKGSSANFRMDELQSLASQMEQRAKGSDRDFNYIQQFDDIKNIIKRVQIV
jgi:signal transduction histidine kinase/DNA-binding response OmpR family regulator